MAEKEERKGFHCDLCRCPIELWEPYKDYPSDRSCELFYFIENLISKKRGHLLTIGGFAEEHIDEVRKEFPDLKNLDGVLFQHFEQQVDIGTMKKFDVFYVSPVWNRKKGKNRGMCFRQPSEAVFVCLMMGL